MKFDQSGHFALIGTHLLLDCMSCMRSVNKTSRFRSQNPSTLYGTCTWRKHGITFCPDNTQNRRPSFLCCCCCCCCFVFVFFFFLSFFFFFFSFLFCTASLGCGSEIWPRELLQRASSSVTTLSNFYEQLVYLASVMVDDKADVWTLVMLMRSHCISQFLSKCKRIVVNILRAQRKQCKSPLHNKLHICSSKTTKIWWKCSANLPQARFRRLLHPQRAL